MPDDVIFLNSSLLLRIIAFRFVQGILNVITRNL